MSDKSRIDEDFSRMIKLAGLSEAPKKAAPAPANPDPKNYGSFSTNNKSPYGYAAPGSDDDTAANFFASSKRQTDAEAPKAAAPKPAAPKPAAPKPAAPGQSVDDIKAFQRANGLTPDGIVGPNTRAAGWGQTAVPAPSSTTPGEKTPWAPKGPQAADLAPPIGSTVSRDGGPANLQMTDEPVRIPVRGNADAPRTAMNNFGINDPTSNSGAPNYSQSISTTPPASSNTPPGRDPRPPANPSLSSTTPGEKTPWAPKGPQAADLAPPIGSTVSRDGGPANLQMTDEPVRIPVRGNADAPRTAMNNFGINDPTSNSGAPNYSQSISTTPPASSNTPPGRDPRPPANPSLNIGGQNFTAPATPPISTPQSRQDADDAQNRADAASRLLNPPTQGVTNQSPRSQYQYNPMGPNTEQFTSPSNINFDDFDDEELPRGPDVLRADKYTGSMFNNDVINELRNLAGLGEEEEDNSPIPFKYTPSPGLPKTAMTGEKDTNPFSKPGAQSGQNSNPFNKPGAGSRMEKESVEDNMDNQGLPHKDEWEYDREGDMAKDQLHSIVRHAEELEHSLGNTENLPEWVQEKMAQIKGMMTGVTDYMMTQHERGEEQRTGEEGIHGDDMEKGNEFSGALAKAKATHQDKIRGRQIQKEDIEQRVDMKGKKCTSCKKGTYQETSQMDDMDGVVHCTKCGKGVKRHQKAQAKTNEGIDVNPISDSLALIKRLAGLK